MKIFIDNNINNLNDLLNQGLIVDINDIDDYSLEQLLSAENLTIVAMGKENDELVSQLVNSRPNEKKKLTMIQTHQNLNVVVDQEGASLIL